MEKPWDGKERREVSWREVTDHMAVTNEILKKLVAADEQHVIGIKENSDNILKLQNWRWFVLGGCSLLSIIFAVLVEVLRK